MSASIVGTSLVRAAVMSAVEIRWPSGRTDVVQHVPANQIVTVCEGAGIVGGAPFAR